MNRAEFESYMNQFRLEPKKKAGEKTPTHALLGPILNKWGSFHIPEDQKRAFFDAYEKYTFKSGNPTYLVERPLTTGAGILKFDFDILFESNTGQQQRNFEPAECVAFVRIIQDELNLILTDCRPENLLTFVLYRPSPYIKSETTDSDGRKIYTMKDGIHIMLPYIYLDYKGHHHIRDVLVTKTKELQLQSIFGFENSFEDFVDASVIESSGWLMYGSTKPNVEPYRLYEIFDECGDPVRNLSFTDRELAELLSIRRECEPSTIHPDRLLSFTKMSNPKKRLAPSSTTSKTSSSSTVSAEKRKASRCFEKDIAGPSVGPSFQSHSIGPQKTHHRPSQASSQLLVDEVTSKSSINSNTKRLYEASNKPHTNSHHREAEINADAANIEENDFVRAFDNQENDCIMDNDVEVVGLLSENQRNIRDVNFRNVCKHVYLLRPERAMSYDKWIQVGLCLFNISNTFKLDLQELYLEFSKQDFDIPSSLFSVSEIDIFLKLQAERNVQRDAIQKKYIDTNSQWDQQCRRTWDSFRKKASNMLNYGSLIYWARLDNPHYFEALLSQNVENIYKEILLSPSHKKIAALLYSRYEGQYLCSDYDKNIWYEWQNHSWRRMDGVSSIRRKITGTCRDSDNLIHEFTVRRNQVLTEKIIENQEIKESTARVEALKMELEPHIQELKDFKERYGDNARAPELKKTVKDLSAELRTAKEELQKLKKEIIKLYIKPYDDVIQKYLETSISIDNIVKEAKQEFFDPQFNLKLNTNPMLFLFNNGVFDLENMMFRDGTPSDYLSIEGSLDQPEYRVFDLESCPEIKDIIKYFEQVLTDPEKREFFLTLIASCLEGHNTNNIFPILTGTGSNAKSLTLNFIEDVFGMYAGKLNSAFLTQKRNKSNSASPELYNIVDCRIVSSEESDTTDELNTAIIKEITGNSRITSRTLYQAKMTTKIPQFTPFLICNDLPNIKSMDGGTWRRIVVISFDSKFVDHPDDPKYKLNTTNSGNIFLIDRTIKQKMVAWREPFMFLLIHKYYKKFKDNDRNLSIPACVVAYTEKYKDENDILQPFSDLFIDITGNPSDTIKLKDLYNRVLVWFRENYQGEREPTMQVIKKYFEQRFGTYESKGWCGKKLIEL